MVGHRYSQFGYFLKDIAKNIVIKGGRKISPKFIDFPGQIMGLHAYGTATEQDVRDLEEWFRHSGEDTYNDCCFSVSEQKPIDGLRFENVYNSLYDDSLSSSDARSALSQPCKRPFPVLPLQRSAV